MKKVLRSKFFRYSALILFSTLAVLIVFPGIKSNLLSKDFLPHSTCYLQNPAIIGLHVTSDCLIGLAYVAISITLAFIVYKASKDIPFNWMFLAFGLFIIACGFTHFMEVWTVWQPVYWLAGYVKVITAAASVTTAILLPFLVPKIFALINKAKISEERRDKMEAANEELRSFSYTISHDLRAPVRSMQGMAHSLMEDYGESLDDSAKDYINRIMDSSIRMNSLINDLLRYSALARDENIVLESVDVQSAIMEAKAELKADIVERQVEVRVEGDFFPAVKANYTLLVQILENLLSNAMKFVPKGVMPKVQLFVEDRGDKVRICIKDNGIGIATEHQRRIFGVFERLHTTGEFPGTGVGLAIVQKAVEKMNASLGLESEPGQGSKFWIEVAKA